MERIIDNIVWKLVGDKISHVLSSLIFTLSISLTGIPDEDGEFAATTRGTRKKGVSTEGVITKI